MSLVDTKNYTATGGGSGARSIGREFRVRGFYSRSGFQFEGKAADLAIEVCAASLPLATVLVCHFRFSIFEFLFLPVSNFDFGASRFSVEF
jgi:hypothetical protein